jgi:hypothetical protein
VIQEFAESLETGFLRKSWRSLAMARATAEGNRPQQKIIETPHPPLIANEMPQFKSHVGWQFHAFAQPFYGITNCKKSEI